ncbi:Fic/DOC family protein [Rubritalea squalenifaciens DSM 18772]|uniref:Fic/DOC family protein n=1 Tax=Rubritalea squalenifaciens DSM 18772 TaxID=1123071 RepID=A0A1M6BPI5_9BACT|nr:Fic family protein [Rubritalea squalenifaciens]SHI50665.1 Fic/DOC family protein [Rubritalea squalenifaciens DSM 18772]
MPSQPPDDELQVILEVVASAPHGISIGELLENSRLDLKRRTLQRRIDYLCDQGLLEPRGEGRGRRYLVPAVTVDNTVPAAKASTVDRGWLGPESTEIRRLVSLPPSKRQPVGYDPSFLESYQPNVTFYLPQKTRSHLVEIGQVGITDLPAGTYLRQILDRLLIDLSWNSSRLEGNTYSLLETQRLLELGESADGKATQEAQMILNHKEAIEMLAEQSEEIGFNRYTVCNLHALLSNNLLSDPAACGRIRSRPVGISGTVFHPLEVPQQIEEYFQLILDKAEAIKDPFETAFFVMVQLPYLQAFEDVNKRVSRLAANIPMIKYNFCPLSFVDIEADDYINALIGVYELQRIEYLRDVFVWAYERSALRYNAVRQSLGDPDPFRLKYRSQIGRFVREIVQSSLDASEAIRWIQQHATTEIPEEDYTQFIETVETELLSLHEGNIARFRLRPGEFANWMSKQIRA